MLRALLRARPHFLRVDGVGQQRFKANRKLDRIAVRHQLTGDAILNHFGGAPMQASNYRLAAGRRFQVHQTESFPSPRAGKNAPRALAPPPFRITQSAQGAKGSSAPLVASTFLEPPPVL